MKWRILRLGCLMVFVLLANVAYCQMSVDSTLKPGMGNSARARAAVKFEEGVEMKAGNYYLLSNLHFEADRHQLKRSSNKELQNLRSALMANQKLKVRIEGHVCCISEAADALDVDNNEPHLSRNRAKAVYDYLVKKGIEQSRLSYIGLGRSRPIILYETTEEEAAINRRVEISVLED
jgi:outer membrane protein OmpA-like peptidoglycan-associated protein